MDKSRLEDLRKQAYRFDHGDERRLAILELCNEVKRLQDETVALEQRNDMLVAQLQTTGMVQKSW